MIQFHYKYGLVVWMKNSVDPDLGQHCFHKWVRRFAKVMCTVNLLGRICCIYYFQNLDEELELHRQDKSALQRVCMRTV